ncbi:MAG: hypothetical protein E7670_01265 [Ruminococcaceae bacterium]|nr:hypothetical protein [Oscillospiraceae bacterium]
MKKRNMIRVLSALLCLCTLLLCSCGKNKFSIDEEGYFVDKNSGVTYDIAPFCYEAISVSEDVFAKQSKREFFAITGADTSKLITDTFGIIYFAKGTAMPTLKEMNVSYVAITNDDVIVEQVSDAEKINALKELYENGTPCPYPGNAGLVPNVNIRLKFADNELGLYYVLAYFEYAQDYVYEDDNGKKTNFGKKFLYNRAEGLCLAVEGLPAGVYGSNG